MIFLPKPVKAQVADLSVRVVGHTRSIMRISYAMAFSTVVRKSSTDNKVASIVAAKIGDIK